MTEISGVTNITAPTFTQDGIDTRHPPGPGRARYRLKTPGAISIDGVQVMGPQMGGAVPSQLVWLSATAAAGFGDLLELAP